jgi:hypothetical protein
MATDKGEDPNEARDDERARGGGPPKISENDQWGEDLNPVRETPQPFGNLGDGGPGAA